LEASDGCALAASFDGGATFEPAVVALADGQDTSAHLDGIVGYGPGTAAAWGRFVLLQLQATTDDADDMCCLHATGISGND
jgi:hypothetical protein